MKKTITNEILSKCAVSGNIVTLPNIQLDRKTYMDVAQKLELIGGKWNRKYKGFLFEQNRLNFIILIFCYNQ